MGVFRKLFDWWQQLPGSSVPPYPLTADEWEGIQQPASKQRYWRISKPLRWQMGLGKVYRFSVRRYRIAELG